MDMKFSNSVIGAPVEENNEFRGSVQEPETSKMYRLGLTDMDIHRHSMAKDSVAYMLANNYGSQSNQYELDESFDKAQAKKNLEDKIHPRYIDNLVDDSVSQEHLDSMMETAVKDTAIEEYMEEQSLISNIGYSIVPELTNLPIYIAGAAAMPATGLAVSSTFVGAALLGATADVGVEAIKDMVGKHDKEAIDYAAAFVMGGAVAGVFGRSAGPMEAVAAADMKRTAGITKEVEKNVANATTDIEKKKLVEEAYAEKTKMELSNSGYEQLDAVINSSPTGVTQTIWSSVRQDLAYMTGQSKSPSISSFSEQMFPDPSLQFLNKSMPDIQSSVARLESRMEGVLQSELQPIVKEFARDILNSKGFMFIRPTGGAEDAFSNLFGYVQKNRGIHKDTPEDVLIEEAITKYGYKSTDKLKNLIKKGLNAASNVGNTHRDLLEEAGNKLFQKGGIKADPNYMHYVYEKQKLTEMRRAGVPEKQLIKFFSNAIRSHLVKVGVKEIDEELLNKVGFSFYKGVSESNVNTGNTFSSMIDDMLKTGGLKKEEKNLLNSMKEEVSVRPDKEAGAPFVGRSGIDYAYKQTLTAKGKPMELKLSDLISDNYVASSRKYYRKSAGATGLQKVKWRTQDSFKTDDTILKELEDNPELQKLLALKSEVDGIKKQLDELGINPDDIIQGAKNLDLPESMAKFIDSIEAKLIELKNIDESIDALRSQLKKEAGFTDRKVKDFMPDFLDIYKESFKRRLKGKEKDEFFSERIEKITEEIVKEFGEEFGNRIASVSRRMADKYNVAGIDANKEVLDIFKKRFPKKKLDRRTSAYKEIEREVRKKAKVHNTVELKEFAKIEEDMSSIRNTIAGEERTLSTKQDIADFREQYSAELQDQVNSGEMTSSKMHGEQVRMNHILNDMQGIPTAENPDGLGSKIQKILASLNIYRLLGQTGATMAAEGATVAMDSGMKNMIKNMPQYGDLLKSYSTGKIENEVLKEMQEATGLLTEFLSSPKAYELSHDFSPSTGKMDGILDKTQGVVDHMAEFTLMVGGIKPLTAMFRVAHMQGVMKQMKEVANGGKAGSTYIKMLNELGLNQDAVANIYANMNKHSKDGLMNFKKWDLDTRNLFLDGVTRRSDTLIQQKKLGDTMGWVAGSSDHLFQSTVMGRVVMELKTFSLVSHTKQLGRVVNRADAHMAMTVAAWTAALSLSYAAKSQVNFYGNREKMEEAMSPEKMIPAVIGAIPMAGIAPQVLDAGMTMAGAEPVFGHSRNSGQLTDQFSALPAADAINNLAKIIGIPADLADGAEMKDFTPAMKIGGVTNSWITRGLVEANK